ncbi:hypothetical protein DH2020_034426 [Rehmannia glutinosa]|uniref:Fe2OG dioxygenase domain-containing protein n=1 Tax=Rehmannia glutinosa TaxID=99300 RepID=A0ABR0VD74_REHGL
MGGNDESCSSFPIGQTAQERGFSHVPECYKVQLSDRAGLDTELADVPLINLDGICDPARRPIIVEEIGNACRCNGFFQVVNHGISQPILDGALSTASDFFNLPIQDKTKFMSNDVHNPVRQKMGEYAVAVQKLAVKIMEAITESLGLGPTYLTSKLDDGMQVLAVNCYPPCPQPELSLGLPPHSDYSCLTIVLQDSPGLQILDFEDKTWKAVPAMQGVLQVHVGDHLEVLSNGKYESVVHKVTLNSEKTRFSIVSLHSLGMDVKMEAAKELVDEDHPNGYRESSFRDFLNFISKNDIGEGSSFLNTLKI